MSRSDRELLEMAAKAANANGMHIVQNEVEFVDCSSDDEWNPLEDDGDALRLAARLNFRVDISYGTVRIVDELDNEHYLSGIVTDCGGQMAIVRLAIVRAAAAIGGKLP